MDLFVFILIVPIIAFLDYIIFGEAITFNQAVKKNKWLAYLIPTFLEFLMFIIGYYLGKSA